MDQSVHDSGFTYWVFPNNDNFEKIVRHFSTFLPLDYFSYFCAKLLIIFEIIGLKASFKRIKATIEPDFYVGLMRRKRLEFIKN